MNLQSLLRDSYSHLLPRLRLIKVDSEGYDLTILRTLDGIIRDRKPFIMTEFFKRIDLAQRERQFDFLAGHGYRIHRVGEDGPLTGEVIERGDLMRWRHFDAFCVPPGVDGS